MPMHAYMLIKHDTYVCFSFNVCRFLTAEDTCCQLGVLPVVKHLFTITNFLCMHGLR